MQKLKPIKTSPQPKLGSQTHWFKNANQLQFKNKKNTSLALSNLKSIKCDDGKKGKQKEL